MSAPSRLKHRVDPGSIIMRSRLAAQLLALAAALSAVPAAAVTASVETLHSFDSDGEFPQAALVQASDGNFYGTTYGGGMAGMGTIFRITPDGELTTVLSFQGSDGAHPVAGLSLGSDGNLYGTTESGGTNDRGTVFRLTPPDSFTMLFHFDNTNGAFPRAAPLQTSDGRVQGVASQGGAQGYGSVYQISSAGVTSTLFSFDVTRGQNPHGRLVVGNDGNYYGTTEGGGTSGRGTVFRITPTGTLTTLASFDGTNGANPQGALLLASDGNFYGTTQHGGANNAGTVFRMTSAGVVTRLVSFGGSDGAGSRATLVVGADGNFYGTTFDTIFRITPAGALTTLFTFTGASAGSPHAGLVRGTDGNFYGTTRDGGAAGKGSVFRMRPPPAPPPGLTATAGAGEVSLSWSPSAAADTYNIYQGTAAGEQALAPVRSGIAGTTAAVVGLESGTYFFTVTAVNGNGESSSSNEAVATVNVPDDFAFTPVSGARPGTTQLSDIVTIAGLLADTEVPVSIGGDAGAAFSVNAAPFQPSPGAVGNGDTLQVRLDAAAAPDVTTTASVNVARLTRVFSVTTESEDATPEPFEFAPVMQARPGESRTSNAITVRGINVAVAIAVSGDAGASYSINGGPFTASAGRVENGSTVRVRLNAPGAFESSATAMLDIGGVSASFTVSTGPDTIPDAFAFTSVSGVAAGSMQASTAITVTGIAAPAPVSVRGDAGAAYSINGGAFTSAPGTISEGDQLQAAVMAASEAGRTTKVTVDVGGVLAEFTVTSANADGGGALDMAFVFGLWLAFACSRTRRAVRPQ